ncbi:hypothetical protein MKW98_014265 [Papaver atlanticum]|uniref:Uncharacterized protein n=1 Tax=Papaver atlanticum TaxID=357466 RepID=A0AAD4SYM6_9MAGN|nr:hypothetical protein MKW98_014265 [Papaver atlanticum]
MEEPTDYVKTMVQKLFSEASKTRQKKRHFSDTLAGVCCHQLNDQWRRFQYNLSSLWRVEEWVCPRFMYGREGEPVRKNK